MRVSLPFVLFGFVLVFFSCKKYQPAEPAFFIKPGTITVKTNKNQGSGSHKITDLWVYVNGQFKGAYPSDHTIPIVSNNKAVTINVFAGIKNNGISDTRINWPFYNYLTLDTLVESGKTIVHSFEFNYKDTTIFAWNEGFEGLGFSLIKSPKSQKEFRIISGNESFEGKSLLISLGGDTSIAQIESNVPYSLPTGNPDVYLELNYKCNQTIETGLIGSSGEEKPVMFLNPQENWNKIYISLAATINSGNVSSKYKVYFKMLKVDGGLSKLYLDNIKLVYLNHS